MAAHKWPASLRPRCTWSGSSVAAIPVYQFTSWFKQLKNWLVELGGLLSHWDEGTMILQRHKEQLTLIRCVPEDLSHHCCVCFIWIHLYIYGVHGGAVCWGTMLQARRLRLWFPMGSFEFLIDIFLPATPRPWCWLSLWQKWIPGIFPGGKGSRYVELTTLPPS
jgi:hypothetical protein